MQIFQRRWFVFCPNPRGYQELQLMVREGISPTRALATAEVDAKILR
jgi:hypothetical protein